MGGADAETAVVILCVCSHGGWVSCHLSGLTSWHLCDKNVLQMRDTELRVCIRVCVDCQCFFRV